MPAIERILDANANRAREALRVMEDVARFGLDHEPLCARIKSLRHGLREVLDRAGADPLSLAASRDTPGDVGTGISTESEGRRDDLRDVAGAACRRLTEALRVLEESLKVGGAGRTGVADAPAGIEALRYDAYDVEKRLLLALGSGRTVQWRLCVLLTASLCRGPWEETARAAAAGGADCLQLREKALDDRELLARGARLVAIARASLLRPAVVINDRPDIALLAGADGVHLGQSDLPVERARALAGARLLVGVSTHDVAEARAAVEAGADYIGIGPVFESTTKARPPGGPALLRAVRSSAGLAATPHLAIGGVTPVNAAEVARAGALGVAVSGCVCGAEDPASVCRRLREALAAHGAP